MNVSLQRQRKELSILTWDYIHHNDGPGSLSHVSSFCVTQRVAMEMHRHTDSFYILEVFRVVVFQQG